MVSYFCSGDLRSGFHVTCHINVLYIDIRNKQKWCRFFIIFGVNPLFLYVLSEVLAIMMGSTGWKAAAYAAIHSGITDAYLASAVYALVFTLFLGCIGYPLYLKKIYIKL